MNGPVIDRRRLLVLGGLAGFSMTTLGAAGCSDNSADGPRAELRIGVQSLPGTMDANASISNSGIQTYYNVYDTLILRDTQADTISFLPGLAESWEQVEELVWEFRLRTGVTFHDGSPFTADDVAYSMNRVINVEDPSYGTAQGYLFANFSSFDVVDDLTVRATTIHPEPLLEHLLSDPNAGISSRAYCERVGLDVASNEPVATGPYRVAEFVPGESLVIERVEDHWSGSAPYERITYVLIPEIASRITALSNDEVDFITNIPPDQEPLLTGDDRVTVAGSVVELYHIYRLNMSNKACSDPKLRAALDYAIDRQAIVDSIWSGKAAVATDYQFDAYADELKIPGRADIAYDPDRARQLLAESGYAGETIEIYNVTNYYTYADLVAQAVVDMWADVGITGRLVQVESIDDEDVELEIRSWSNPLYYPDPMGMIERHWAPTGESVNSGHFIPSDAYIDAFERARYSQDEAVRVEALVEMFDYYRAETPFIYLFKPYEAIAMRSTLEYVQSPNLRPYCLSFRLGDIAEVS